jgi:hypothetical protein
VKSHYPYVEVPGVVLIMRDMDPVGDDPLMQGEDCLYFTNL